MKVFVYGSLMSLRSLRVTLPEKKFSGVATLPGYRRATSKLSSQNILFMNLVRSVSSSVEGKLVDVSEKELEEIRKREQGAMWMCKVLKFLGLFRGYEMVEVKVVGQRAEKIIAFIAPHNTLLRDHGVLRSYLNVCLNGVPKRKRKKWIEETELGGFIIEDAESPRYGVIDKNVTKTKI